MGLGMQLVAWPPAMVRSLVDAGYRVIRHDNRDICLLYTSDAADERSSVDLGGRRIIKKKNTSDRVDMRVHKKQKYHQHSR